MSVPKPEYVRILRAPMIRHVALVRRVLQASANVFHSVAVRRAALMGVVVRAALVVVEMSASLMVSATVSKPPVLRGVPASRHVSVRGSARLIVLACALRRREHRLGTHSTNGLLVF